MGFDGHPARHVAAQPSASDCGGACGLRRGSRGATPKAGTARDALRDHQKISQTPDRGQRHSAEHWSSMHW
jgi:hypothetical protein